MIEDKSLFKTKAKIWDTYRNIKHQWTMNIIVPIQAMIEIDRRLALMTENRNNFSFNEDFTTIILGLLAFEAINWPKNGISIFNQILWNTAIKRWRILRSTISFHFQKNNLVLKERKFICIHFPCNRKWEILMM